jgi:ferredoxin
MEQKLYEAPAGWLESCVAALLAAGVEVLAPTQQEQGLTEFARIVSPDAVHLERGNAMVPLKRVFLPPSEVLLEFEKAQGSDVKLLAGPSAPEGEAVVLGCRPCDAAALGVLDAVFQRDYEDVRYRARRERVTLVTFACTEPDEQCFCTSVGGSPQDSRWSDVLVFPTDGGGALLQVHTAKGQKFIERLGDLARPAPQGTEPPAPPDLPHRFDSEKVKKWLDANFESEFWQEVSLRCIGCGACSYLCPTCHCFDMVDEGAWNKGQRRRNWDCCALALFTRHASGHNPRPNQAARYRQRVMHKFKYYPERFGAIACVGCGRCMRACRVGQNLVSILSDIASR